MGEVESNRKRTGSLQDDELVSAACSGEPALGYGEAWTGNGPIGRAEVTTSDVRAHDVVGGWMPGRQNGVSGETCPTCERRAGVRALVLLQR